MADHFLTISLRCTSTSILLKKYQITCFVETVSWNIVTTITTIRFPRKRSTIIHQLVPTKKKTSRIEQFILDTVKRQEFVFENVHNFWPQVGRVYLLRNPVISRSTDHTTPRVANGQQIPLSLDLTCRCSDNSTPSTRSAGSRFHPKLWVELTWTEQPLREYITKKSRLTRETRRNAEAEVACLPARTLLFGEPIGLSPGTGVRRIDRPGTWGFHSAGDYSRGEKWRRVSTRINQGWHEHRVCCLGKRRQKTAAPTDVSFAPTLEPARSGCPSGTGGGPSSDGMQHSATFSAGPSTRNIQTLPLLLFSIAS